MHYEAQLAEIMMADPDVFVLTAENRGPCIHIGEKFPDRFLDTGINEQSLVAIAAGLAKMGNKPVIHALACFLTMRPFEFIRTDVGLSRLPVKMVGTMAGLLSESNGPTHQAVEDVALMRAIPEMNIFCPASEDELVIALPTILSSPEPWYIRHNTRTSTHSPAPFEIGQAEVIGHGRDVAILTYGLMLREALKLQRLCDEGNVKARVVNMRCLRPFDKEAILVGARECGRIIVIEDHLPTGGLRTIVAETLMETSTMCNVLVVTLRNYFRPGPVEDVLLHEKLSAESIWPLVSGKFISPKP